MLILPLFLLVHQLKFHVPRLAFWTSLSSALALARASAQVSCAPTCARLRRRTRLLLLNISTQLESWEIGGVGPYHSFISYHAITISHRTKLELMRGNSSSHVRRAFFSCRIAKTDSPLSSFECRHGTTSRVSPYSYGVLPSTCSLIGKARVE